MPMLEDGILAIVDEQKYPSAVKDIRHHKLMWFSLLEMLTHALSPKLSQLAC